MDTIEKTISNFIENQFPAVYRELGPTFTLFVKKYYEWMEEQGNVMYHTRRVYEYRDIDETTTQFLNHFKETYLKNIQLTSATNTRTLVKHSLDLYRSKGSEQSIQLLFRLAFGTDAEIYYPRDDLLKPSDGWWYEPEYLEITLSEENRVYAGTQIIGSSSKATAYVEKVVRRYAKDYRLTDILYISARQGEFRAGDIISRVNPSNPRPIEKRAVLLGSLNGLSINQNGSGSEFRKGDIVEVLSEKGIGAKARVTRITPTTGQVTLSLVNGGYGYNSNSDVLISEKVITVQGQLSNLTMFETIIQPLANINYLNATGLFNQNDIINTYHANNLLKGSAKVLSNELSNTTAGKLMIEILTGNLIANAFYTSGNTVSANQSIISGFVNRTATGNVIGWTINATSNTTKIGLKDIENAYYDGLNSVFVYSTQTNETGPILKVSKGSNLNFRISNSLLHEEWVFINNDYLKDYIDVPLNANNYGFKGVDPVINANSLLSFINWANTIFGRIQFIENYNPGMDYNEFPFVAVFDKGTAPQQRHDLRLTLDTSPAPFVVGELVTQANTNGRGIIIAKNVLEKTIDIQNLRVLANNDFQPSNIAIVGFDSAFEAIITKVDPIPSSNVQGYNAIFSTQLNTANGAAQLQILDSGFGYKHGELIRFHKDDANYGYAFANVTTQGHTLGYYKDKGGQLSDTKRLFDGHYYQQFSYDVLSSVALNKYEKLLKDIVHTAGYALFGTIKIRKRISTYSKRTTTRITIQ